MAHSTTTASLSRVNRRFLFLALILAALSGVLVYPLLTRSSDSGGASSAVDVSVVVAKASIPAGTTITAEMLELRQVPQSAVGALPFSDVESVVGEVARYPIVANEQVLASKVIGGSVTDGNTVVSSILEIGKRGLAIRTEVVVSAGGLVLPGDYVDIFWVPQDSEEDVLGAQLLAEDVEVISVDQTIVDLPPTALGLQEEGEAGATTGSADQRVRGSEEEPNPEAVTLTLMVTPAEIQSIFCGEETGTLRLAVRAFGDHSPSGLTPVGCIVLGTNTD